MSSSESHVLTAREAEGQPGLHTTQWLSRRKRNLSGKRLSSCCQRRLSSTLTGASTLAGLGASEALRGNRIALIGYQYCREVTSKNIRKGTSKSNKWRAW